MYHHLLVPLDGTPLAGLLTEQALELARCLGARVTFLHVQPDVAQTDDGAVLHSVAPEAFQDCASGNAHAVVARAASAARAAGVPHQAQIVVADKAAQAIAEAAGRQGCDLIVIASHGRQGWRALRQASVTQRLLRQTPLPVHVAAVESQLAGNPAALAASHIKAEHRSMDAVLHGLMKVWKDARAVGRAPDYALLRAMLFYIARFPERLHHPKEDAYLFARLQRRTKELDPLIRHLRDQHEQGSALFDRLQRNLAQVQAGEAGAAERFDRALEDFARAQWKHMADEERLVLPAAQRYLTPEDWAEMARAFGENGDPRFGAGQDEAFEQLFARLLRLAETGG